MSHAKKVQEALTELGRAAHPRELAARLSIDPEDFDDFFAELSGLLDQGLLRLLPGGRVRLAERQSQGKRRPGDPRTEAKPARDESYTGVLSMNPRGFGFVSSAGRPDVFIPPDRIYEALHGDSVEVRISGRSDKGFEGSIESIVRRRNPRIAGTLRRKGRALWLEPDDSRLRGPITLPDGAEAAEDGVCAVVEITRFPLFAEELCEAKLVQVLGKAGDLETEVQKILLRESISETHAERTLENAREMAELLGKLPLGSRRDLRAIPLPTIDPEDARDHDDAIWVERTAKGYRAYVAIADVSEYVREGSALDEEARARGCTIYLPDRAIPMLPSVLAKDLCSLVPGVDRYCLCVIMDLNSWGQVGSYEVVEGLMRSAEKLTYGGVARALGWDSESPVSPGAERMKADLAVLAELAQKLRRKRMARGALDLDLPEAQVKLDPKSSAIKSVEKRASRPGMKRAYSMVEEMMLLANELMAQWLTERQAPAIYRVHGAPDPKKLERVADVASVLGVSVSLEELSEPLGASSFLQEVQDHPQKRVLEMLLLRALKQAQYDIENLGHFGLASGAYLHFTSPIRRYPDLVVHRQVKSILRGKPVDASEDGLEGMRQSATQSSVRERASMEIEREVMDLYRALYLRDRIGERFQATITAITGSGVFTEIESPFCDVLVLYEGLFGESFETSEDELRVVGRRSGETFGLGDVMEIEITDVSLERRTAYGQRVTKDGLTAPWLSEAGEPRGARPRSVRPRAGSSGSVRATAERETKKLLPGSPKGRKPQRPRSEGSKKAGRQGKKSSFKDAASKKGSAPKASSQRSAKRSASKGARGKKR